MLDQNADRMYWVIGALLIVGLLIAIARQAFPDLLKNVLNVMNDDITDLSKSDQSDWTK